MGLKLAVIGGGSTYTPELVDGFARRADRVRIDEIALLDIDPERLAIVGGLAERMLARQGWTGRVLQTTNRDAAIEGADFVLIQLRVGGQQAVIGLFNCVGRHGRRVAAFSLAGRRQVGRMLAEELLLTGDLDIPGIGCGTIPRVMRTHEQKPPVLKTRVSREACSSRPCLPRTGGAGAFPAS